MNPVCGGYCGCIQCAVDKAAALGKPFMRKRMHLCDCCGNKRCPHATDHRNACTDSNEPGQAGSWYGDWRLP